MNKFDRIFTLYQYLHARCTPATMEEICDRLECSRQTVTRTMAALRDELNAPLEYKHGHGHFLNNNNNDQIYELPGLWFNDSELYALLITQQLLKEIQPGLLEEQIAPLRHRLNALLQQKQLGAGELEKRVRILRTASRTVDLDKFRNIATAVGQRRCLNILYHGRERDKITERKISPQRLVYYRDNWYLDAWCHLRKEIRSFSIDRIEPRKITDEAAKELNEQDLQAYLSDSYGIFAGKAKRTALLRFSPKASKWVSDEQWHPRQEIKVLKNGSLEMKIPYNKPTELIMNILKYGPEVEVIKPVTLRKAVSQQLLEASRFYENQL